MRLRLNFSRILRNPTLWIEILVSVLFFLLSLWLYTHTVDLNLPSARSWNFIFDADSKRAVSIFFSPIDTTASNKHPLYKLFFRPFGILFQKLHVDSWEATRFVTAACGAAAVALAFLFFLRRGRCFSNQEGARIEGGLFTLGLAVSAAVWLFSSIPEAYSFNLLAIVAGFWLQARLPASTGLSYRPWVLFHVKYLVYAVLAVGASLINLSVVYLCLVNAYRRSGLSKWPAFYFFIAFNVVFFAFLSGLSVVQHQFFPKAFLFSGPWSIYGACVVEQKASGIFFVERGEFFNKEWLSLLARTFWLDSWVAPEISIKHHIQYGRNWTILWLSHRWDWSYVVCLIGIITGLFMLFNHRVRRLLVRDSDFVLSLGLLGFPFLFSLFFRGVIGVPFMLSMHTVFPLIVLFNSLYLSLPAHRLRIICLLVFTGALLANNAHFMARVQNLLETTHVVHKQLR